MRKPKFSEPSEEGAGEFFIGTEEIRSFVRCSECGCTSGIHLVSCSCFKCRVCGQYGYSPEHHGGCPNAKQFAAKEGENG